MKSILLAFLLLFAPALAQQPPMGPGAPPPSTSRPLFDNVVSSSGIVFPTATEVQIPVCSTTLPAGILANVKDKIKWWAAGTNTASTDLKTIQVRLGATPGSGTTGNIVGGTTNATASGGIWTMQGIISKLASNSQKVSAMGTAQLSGNSGAVVSNTVNAGDTAALLIIVTGKSANAAPPNDTVICNEFHVSFEAGAPLP